MPAAGNTKFAIGKIDHQLRTAHRLERALHLLRQLHQQQHRRRPLTRRSGHRLRRPAALGGRPARLDVRQQPAERGSACSTRTRSQSRVPGSQAGTGPAIDITGVANFGGPIAATPTRASASREASSRSSTTSPTPRQPRLQVRLHHAVRARLAHADADPAVYVPDDRRLPGGQERRDPLRLHAVQQFLGKPSYDYDTRCTRSSCRTTGGWRRT